MRLHKLLGRTNTDFAALNQVCAELFGDGKSIRTTILYEFVIPVVNLAADRIGQPARVALSNYRASTPRHLRTRLTASGRNLVRSDRAKWKTGS